MASGKLGAADIPAGGTWTLIYTVPASTVSTINVRFANRGDSACRVSLAIGRGASPANTDYLSYNQLLPANGIIEDTGVVCSAGENVWAISDVANVSVRVHGFEEAE